jgi:hypothetical protein
VSADSGPACSYNGENCKKTFLDILTAATIAMILKCILDDCKILDLELHVSCNDTVLKLYSINSGIT